MSNIRTKKKTTDDINDVQNNEEGTKSKPTRVKKVNDKKIISRSKKKTESDKNFDTVPENDINKNKTDLKNIDLVCKDTKYSIRATKKNEKSEAEIFEDLKNVVLSLVDDYDKLFAKTLEWKLDLNISVFGTHKIRATRGSEQKLCDIVIIGTYDTIKDKFMWFLDRNELFYSSMLKFIKHHGLYCDGDTKMETVLYDIFTKNPEDLRCNHKFITFLSALSVLTLNLVRIADNNKATSIIYALVDLGLNNMDYINYKKFMRYMDDIHSKKTHI